MKSGRVLRIERASKHDGAGIRTVVFLKGCPLRCIWCSTPESQSGLYEVGFVRSKCTLCGKCVAACPQDGIWIDDGRIGARSDRCVGCGSCVKGCREGAVRLYGVEMTSEEVVREIMKDSVFYQGIGGFTFSGGEPLGQPAFVLDIFKRCAEYGIRGTVETCFYVPWENIEPLLPYLDVIYIDLKHMRSDVHERITGVRNELILENIRKADERGQASIIRVPCIPGINDSEENFTLLASFCGTLKHLRAIEILPYHRLGLETYRNLGREEPLRGVLPPEKEALLSAARRLARALGLPVRVGGAPVLG